MDQVWSPPSYSPPEPGSGRLISPARAEAGESIPPELSLEEVRALAEGILREAVERVTALSSKADALEQSIARRRAEAEAEFLAAKSAAERELADWRENRRAEEEAA